MNRFVTLFALVASLFDGTEVSAQEDPKPLQVLRDHLSDPKNKVVLYRLHKPTFKGRVWIHPKGIERPSQKIPHMTIPLKKAKSLTAFATGDHLRAGSTGFLSYSYILEFLREGKPVARVDFHTRGFGRSCIMLIAKGDKRLKDGSSQLLLTAKGRKGWLAALDKVWKERSK